MTTPLSSIEIERVLYAESLSDFMRGAWAIVEPATILRWNWHLDAIAEFLTAVTACEIQDGAIEMPPRFGKSLTVGVLWPAWMWVLKPETRWIFGSYAQHLTLRDAVKTRDVIQSPWYQERWPLQLAGDQNVKGYYRNEHGGHRFATSVGGGATGEGADIIVVDDPLKAQDAHSEIARGDAKRWWRETMPSRLNNPRTGRRVVVMQRLHEDDLAGYCREAGYDILSLPVEYNPHSRCTIPKLDWQDPRTTEGELLFPEHFGPDEVVKYKRELGSYAFAGQYNQEPAPDDGSSWFPADWWQRWTDLPRGDDGTYRRPDDALVSWDMTFTGKRTTSTGNVTDPDYVIGQLWYRYGADTYLIDETRGQWSFTEAKRAVVAFDARCREKHAFPPLRHVVEAKANGEAILSELKPVVQGMVGFNPDKYGDKTARALAVQPRVEAGQVYLPAGQAWVDEWIHELRVFPQGRNDDRVDAFSQAHLASSGRRWGAA